MILKKYHYKKITSTNDKSIKLIKQGCMNGVVTTDYQTKGKGRQGKKWISMKGNLYMTIFFEISKKTSYIKFNEINLKLIKKALQNFSNKKINIKYPNDLIIMKEKICGILQETIFNKNKKFLIIGIGVNINGSPKIKNYSTSYLNNYSTVKVNKLIVSNHIKNVYEKNNIGI